MALNIIFVIALFSEFINYSSAHVGQPCSFIRICLASNSYCDSENICRCKSDYPVNVSLHTCKKGRRYSDQCGYSEECQYLDANSYCTQLPYRSTCECYSGYLYSETKQQCEKIVAETPKPSNAILPTAIGLSLAFAGVLCCCMIVWHVCKKENFVYWNFLPRNTFMSHSQRDPIPEENQNTFLPPDESLPTYTTALSLKAAEEDCEPPPSYDEVVKSSESFSKV